MRKSFLWFAALGLASCTQGIKVEVTNNSPIEHDDQTVEIAWSEFASIKGLTPDNIIVVDDNGEGEQIPSQVIYFGESEPQSLIFQVDADAHKTERFEVMVGTRKDYRSKAYGRHVPERKDDYAWENDKVIYRAYGPALETAPGEMLATPGFDIWVKDTEKLVIDTRYQRGDYHHNYGDGMDCYKVGKTLGGGASAPLVNGQLWFSRNYATQQTLDNGPIRTTVKFTYAPFDVDGTPVSLTKYISLDANSYFNRMENIYEGDFVEMPIASGFVRHDVKEIFSGAGWLGMSEAASDSKQPEIDGDIYLGILQPGAEILPDSLGHAMAVKRVKPGEKAVYYAGSAWSHADIENPAEWIEEIVELNATITQPLQVVVFK